MPTAAPSRRRASRAKPKGKGKPATPTAPGTFEVPARCKLSRVLSADPTRPILTHAFLRRRKDGGTWLLATDSYHAAAIKIEPEGDLVDGFVPAGALRLMERGQKAEQLSPYAWRVETSEGLVTYDVEALLRGSVDFPDFEKLNVWTPPSDSLVDGEKGYEFGVNPTFLISASAAIGLAKFEGLRIKSYGPLRPLYVYGSTSSTDRVGVVMPVRVR